LRIALVSLNPLDHDTRTRLICDSFLDSGWELDIIVPVGGEVNQYRDADLHIIPFSTWPIRQRKVIEFNYRAYKTLLALDSDIVYAVDLDTLWAAAKSSKITQSKIVFESREYFPGQLSVEKRSLVKFFWNVMQNQLLPKADVVLTVNESIAQLLVGKYSIRKPEIVMNVPQLSGEIQPVDLRREYGFKTEYVMVFQGVLRPGQGLVRSVKAVAANENISLLVIGDGPERRKLEQYINDYNLTDRVKCSGMLPSEVLLNYTAGADAGFMLIEPLALNSYLALPQKLFQYIAAGVPPVVTALPELEKIVLTEQLGLVLDKDSSSEDSVNLKRFIENSLEGCRKACQKTAANYDWEKERKKLIALCRRLSDD